MIYNLLQILSTQLPQATVELPQYANFQEWLQDTSYYEMIFKGLAIGIMVSAPMGPVGILCIQRTLNKGRWEGFATGVGAALSDIIYAVITGYAYHLVVSIIEDPVIAWWAKIIGGIVFILFGLYTFMSKPVEMIKPVKRSKGTLSQNFLTGFAVTFSNPLIITVYVAAFSMFTFIITNNIIAQIIGYLCIVVGAVGWWFGLTWLVDKVRNKYNVRIIWLLNRAIGMAVMIGATIYTIYTLTGNSLDLSDFAIPFKP